jgi:peptide/nickel transport system substrate-binding protein
MKKLISVVLILVFLFSLCGCNEVENSSEPAEITTENESKISEKMTLLYSDTDTFNPYDAKTEINRQLCHLLYEPLVKLDNEFKPHYSVASSVKIDKDVCTVKIRDILFSDDTSVTADDVIYSYKLAKKSTTIYKYKLYEVESVRAIDSKTVEFKLKKQDPYFMNMLDFPIIKAGSDKKTDSDSIRVAPTGCGRYKLNKLESSLLQNVNYHGKAGSIKKIEFINAPDTESVSHYVEIGASDIYYSDISDGTIYRMSGAKTDINLNNVVYIGVNFKDSRLELNELRQALSSGIDRQKICKGAYYGNAVAATGFFHPVWEPTKALQNIQITANSQITIENLKEIGYNDLDRDGYLRKGNSVLRFSLLVNKENSARVQAANLIAKQLKEYGIGVRVVKVSFKEYKKRLKEGDFELYLGEVKITENMDLGSLVSVDGSAAFGIKAAGKSKKEDTTNNDDTQTEKPKDKELLDCARIINGFYKGKNSINDVAATLQSDMPIIPICYRTGVLIRNENIEGVDNASVSDIYFSIESYKIKLD